MTRTIRPFADLSRDYFSIHNYVFDVCMPELSNAGWRVLCVAVRKTLGWKAPGAETNLDRKEWDQISYSQFMEASGLKSPASISKGIDENLEAGYLIRRRVGTHQGTRAPLYAYALNQDFEATVPGDATTESVAATSAPKMSTSKTVVAATTENEVAATTESVETKLKKNKQTVVDVVTTTLQGLGIAPRLAQEIAEARSLAWVDGHLDHLDTEQGQGIRSAAAYLVWAHREGVDAPGRQPSPDKANRYISGEYAEFIEH